MKFLFPAGILAVATPLVFLQTDTKNQNLNIPKTVTFAEHVSPILQNHCVSCHKPGEVAPFSLTNYQDAKKFASMIHSSTEARRMPPWKATKGYGEFLDENILSPTQLAVLKKWTETGAQPGDLSKLSPEPKVVPQTWTLGTPDLVLKPGNPFKLEAEGDDVYRNFIFDPKLKETVWVNAMDVKPGNKKVVHHVIAFLDSTGRVLNLEKRNQDGQEGYTSSGGGIGVNPSGALGGWAPGVRPTPAQNKAGFKLEPGTKIVMQVHYHKSGKPEEDLTQMGLYFSKEKVENELEILWFANPMMRLKAGEAANKVSYKMRVPTDATLYSVMPHMHLLGKSMKAKLTDPKGNEIPLVMVENWDFNWQLVYTFKEPVKIKSGSTLSVEAVYDNSSGNPNNPNDPPKDVTWGEQTTDEMALLVVAYSVDPGGRKITEMDQAAGLLEQVLRGRGGGN